MIYDQKNVIDKLVGQYDRLFGQASHEVSKEAVVSLVADLLFTRMYVNLRALLDLRLLRMVCDQGFKTFDRLIEAFRMHQLDTGFISMDSAGKLL